MLTDNEENDHIHAMIRRLFFFGCSDMHHNVYDSGPVDPEKYMYVHINTADRETWAMIELTFILRVC